MQATENKPLRVGLYGRVSTRDKGQDAENQLRQLREFASAQGWTIAGEYVDQASGKTDSRPAFQLMFEHAYRRKIDIVLFWSLDRFSREGVSETLNHLQRLTSYGCNYRSFTEQYLDSCGIFKDAVLAILAVVAKQERIRITERVTAGLDRARAEGRIGGRPKLILDRTSAKQMRKDGASLSQIADTFAISKTSTARLTR